MFRIKELSAIAVLFVFLMAAPFAGATVINGRVIEHATSDEIAGVHIRLEGTGKGDVTNLSGDFRIDAGDANPPFILIVSHISYKSDTIRIEDRTEDLEIAMLPTAIRGDDVVVTGQSGASGTTDEGWKIGSGEIAARRDAGAVNLGDLLLGIAGVNIQVCCALDSRAELRLLGLPGAYTEITLDGIPEIGGLAANYRLYTYPAIGITNMDLLKGASSAVSQAKALGGQLDIQTRHPESGPAQGSVAAYHRSVGGNQLQGEFAVEHDGIGFATAFDMARGEAFDRDGDGWSEAPAIDRTFGRARLFLGKESGIHGTISGLYISEDRLGGMIGVTRDNFGHEPFWIRSVLTKRYEGNASLGLPLLGGNLAVSTTTAGVSLDQIAGNDHVIIDESGFAGKGTWEGVIGKSHFSTGVEYHTETAEETSPETPGRLDGTHDRISVIAEDLFYPSAAMSVKLGLRLDGNATNEIAREWNLFPRLAFTLDANDELFFVLSLGSGGRFRPSVQELMEGYDHAIAVEVPSSLLNERGVAASLGAEWRRIFRENILTIAGGASHSRIDRRIVPIAGEHHGVLTYINADGPTDVTALHLQGNLDIHGRIIIQLGGEITRATTEIGGNTENLPFTPEWRGFGKAVWKDALGIDGLKLWANSTFFGKQYLPENSYGIGRSEPTMIHDIAATFRFGAISITGGVWNVFDAVQSVSPLQGTADPFATGVSTELVYGPLVGRTLVASVVYHFGLPSNVRIGWGYGGLVSKDDVQIAIDNENHTQEHAHGPDCDHGQEITEHIHGEDCDHDIQKHEDADKTVETNIWLIDSEGAHYTCPVTGNMGILDNATPFSIVDGRKFYHCSPECEDEDKIRSALESGFVVPGNAIGVEGDAVQFLCPVMGNEGIADEGTNFTDYEGKRYFFCCAPCKPKFEASPEEYIR